MRVTLIARAARENGATGLRFAYENGLAISPWQTANLGNDFQIFNLVWRVPAMRADPNTDQLLIEPGIPGDGTAADIQSIKLDLSSSRVGKGAPAPCPRVFRLGIRRVGTALARLCPPYAPIR